MGVDQNDNKLNQSQEKNTGKLSFLGSPVGFLSRCSRPASSLGLPGYHSLGRHIPGLFPAALGDSVVFRRHFFFSPKSSVLYKNNCIFKYYFVFGDVLLCPQPRTEMRGITGPFTGINECRRTGLCAWDAQDQISQRC